MLKAYQVWHKDFFDSLKKSSPKTGKELIKMKKKYIRLDDASKVKRQQDPCFCRKKMSEETIGEINEK